MGTPIEALTARIYSRTGQARLPEHLANRYGVDVASVAPLDPGAFCVNLRNGTNWIARIFPAARPVERAEGDAAVLRVLERHGYPAERCAVGDPVSQHDGQAVLVTRYVVGTKARGSDILERLGTLLGRLHTLEVDDAGVARPAGALHHWSVDEGGPQEDVAAARSWLGEEAARQVGPALDALAERVEGWEGLPQALIHPDFQPENVLVAPNGELVVVDWTGAGRGPRIASLAVLLWLVLTANGRNFMAVDAVMAGYRRHVRLEPEELDELGWALRIRPLVFACFQLCLGIRPLELTTAEWSATCDLADAVAARVRARTPPHGGHHPQPQ